MNQSITPPVALSRTAYCLGSIILAGRSVISGSALPQFNKAARAATAACSSKAPTAALCRKVEGHLGLMSNYFLDAIEAGSEIGNASLDRSQVQEALDYFEAAGTACNAAGRWTPLEAVNGLKTLLPGLIMMGGAVISGSALPQFNKAARAATAACSSKAPTAALCRDLEANLGQMAAVFAGCGGFLAKPAEQQKHVLDCIDLARDIQRAAGRTVG